MVDNNNNNKKMKAAGVLSTSDIHNVVQNVMEELDAIAAVSASASATTTTPTRQEEEEEEQVDDSKVAETKEDNLNPQQQQHIEEEEDDETWDSWIPPPLRSSSIKDNNNNNNVVFENVVSIQDDNDDDANIIRKSPESALNNKTIPSSLQNNSSSSSWTLPKKTKTKKTKQKQQEDEDDAIHASSITHRINSSSSSRRSHHEEDASYPNTRALEKVHPDQAAQQHQQHTQQHHHHPTEATSNVNVNEEMESTISTMSDHHHHINFLKDDRHTMTKSRRLALKLMNQKWYNPNAGQQLNDDYDDDDNDNNYNESYGGDGNNNNNNNSINGRPAAAVAANGDDTNTNAAAAAAMIRKRVIPSLERAWAYFEHVTLTRYIVHEGENIDTSQLNLWQRYKHTFTHANEEFERAQPGEKRLPTRLYDWIATPHKQLGDFGLGFGLYFSTIRALRNILFVAGLISAFNIYFFASKEYDNSNYDVDWLMKGSAVCTQTAWVPCMDCICSSSDQGWHRTERCEVRGNLTFVVKNQCMEDDYSKLWVLGLINYAVLVFLVISIYFALGRHLDKEAIVFDEDEQTAQDYSILIKNPPPNANDPEEWREFFEGSFPGVKVVAVSCNVNNDLLIKSLVRRRETLRRMELKLDPGTSMDIDNLALLAAEEAARRSKYFGPIKGFFLPGLPELLSKLVALNTSIKGLTQLSYPCTNVYVTFEMEKHQRMVLSKFAVGLRYIRKNDASVLEDPKLLFKDRVLQVMEPSEPNSVRWQDLNASKAEKTKESLSTTVLSFASIYVCALIVTFADSVSPGFGAAFTISGLNLGYPQLAKFITNFESHRNESKVQTSLYIKIATFRWVNTAIVITVITPFTHTLTPSPGLISQIAAIFFAEIVTTNVIQLTDVWGHIQRHFLAPRAKTQDAMNRWFKGLEVELAERYTNMTKIMFLAFWYSSIFPGGLLFAAVALTVNYYTDRFSLMRSWQRAPSVGKEIAVFSRHYFMSSACVILAMMSSFYWSAFPFDNLCPTEESVNATQIGNYTIEDETVMVDSTSDVYRFCNQDFILRPSGPNYPFIYREGEEGFGEWMSEEQRFLSRLFGWTSVAVLSLVVLKFIYGIGEKVRKQFVIRAEPIGDDQGIGFHDVRNIAGYVPQVRSPMFSYPLIVCPTKKLGDELFDWTDPDLDYEYYDLTKDADHVLTGGNRPGRNSFDRVMYWSPESHSNAVNNWRSQKRRIELSVKRSRRSQNIFNAPSTSKLSFSQDLAPEQPLVCLKCGTPFPTPTTAASNRSVARDASTT